MSYNYTSPIAIVGAGPAGCAASFELSKNKIPHLVLDKAVFPRDKICGDGLSPRVFFVLRKIYPELISEMGNRSDKFKVITNGLAVAPNGKMIKMPITNPEDDTLPPSFTAKRLDLDDFLVEHLDKTYATTLFDANVKTIVRQEKGFEITFIKEGKEETAWVEVVVGADGDRSIVKKNLAPAKIDFDHYIAGIRAYYSNVTGMSDSLEFHLDNDILPGYFWIFPLANGQANVGVGMLSNAISKEKVNLKERMMQIIEKNPDLKARFANATLDEKVLGWGLPVGSQPKKTVSGDGFMLIGDAGSFIDPVSGEGIAGAFYTGMYAAQAILQAKGDYSAANFYEFFDKKIKRTMGFEFKFSYFLQKLFNYPSVLNFIANTAARNKFLIKNIDIFFDHRKRRQFYNPIFTLRLMVGFLGIG